MMVLDVEHTSLGRLLTRISYDHSWLDAISRYSSSAGSWFHRQMHWCTCLGDANRALRFLLTCKLSSVSLDVPPVLY